MAIFFNKWKYGTLMSDKKIQVNSSQFNYVYNGRIHFPYSIATLVAHVKSKKIWNLFLNLKKHLFLEIILRITFNNVKKQIFFYVLVMFGIGQLLLI